MRTVPFLGPNPQMNWILDGKINIDAHFVCAVDELKVQIVQQLLFLQLVLQLVIS